MRITRYILVAALLTVLIPGLAAKAEVPGLEAEAKRIEGQLICTCGCTMIVKSCECGTAGQIREDIREKLAGGMSGEEVLAKYVDSYGETVLAAPTKKGFNLVAWITPIIMLFAGGIVVLVLIRKWSKAPLDSSSVEESSNVSEDDLLLYRDLVDKERKKYL